MISTKRRPQLINQDQIYLREFREIEVAEDDHEEEEGDRLFWNWPKIELKQMASLLRARLNEVEWTQGKVALYVYSSPGYNVHVKRARRLKYDSLIYAHSTDRPTAIPPPSLGKFHGDRLLVEVRKKVKNCREVKPAEFSSSE